MYAYNWLLLFYLFSRYFDNTAVELLCGEKIQPDAHQVFSGEHLTVILQ